MPEEKKPPIEKLMDIYGNAEAAHRALAPKVKSRQVIEYWVKQGYIPFCHGTLVMRVTMGAIDRFDIWMDASEKRGDDK